MHFTNSIYENGSNNDRNSDINNDDNVIVMITVIINNGNYDEDNKRNDHVTFGNIKAAAAIIESISTV